jgi:hypothetical protein
VGASLLLESWMMMMNALLLNLPKIAFSCFSLVLFIHHRDIGKIFSPLFSFLTLKKSWIPNLSLNYGENRIAYEPNAIKKTRKERRTKREDRWRMKERKKVCLERDKTFLLSKPYLVNPILGKQHPSIISLTLTNTFPA